MQKVFFTGGTGYVGSRLLQHFSCTDEFQLIAGIRNLSSPVVSKLRDTVEFMHFDILDFTPQCLLGIDTIIHLAALNENVSQSDPEKALEITGRGTLRILTAAKKAGVRRFIYLSTAHVYGSPLAGLIDEACTCRPIHPYAITHKVAEDFVLAAHDKREMEGIVLRLSNGIGAPFFPEVDRWTLLLNDLCRQAVTQKRLILRSHGLQYRDFISMKNICQGFQHMLTLPLPLCGDGLFNLGGACSLRIIDVAEIVSTRYEKMTGQCLSIERPAKDEAAPTEKPLEYSIDKIRTTGFSLADDFVSSVDETLYFCMKAFNP